MERTMKIQLVVWRQKNKGEPGAFVTYDVPDISPDMSFLEMLDVVNVRLESQGEQPIAFEHDCREGICGSCSMMINGEAHGPVNRTTTCQLHMRSFKSGDTIMVEPWRAKAFPVLKDLIVDRAPFDRIVQSGGFISVNTGSAVDANSIPVAKDKAERAMDAAACIGCGACVAACPNGSAMLFTAAKLAHLSLLPQGEVEQPERVVAMVEQMDKEGFGACTNHGECQEACPKGISINFIAKMNRDYLKAQVAGGSLASKGMKAQ
jgi:succinate dehydrogenase / fumarate reductase iron-sulfur subunit